MKIPVIVLELREEFVDVRRVRAVREGANFRPVADHRGQRGEPPLRMIRRPLAAHPPQLGRDLQPLEFGAAAATNSPKGRADRRGCEEPKAARSCGRKSADAEEQRIGVAFAQQAQRQALGEKREGQLVALVAERGRERLEERFVRRRAIPRGAPAAPALRRRRNCAAPSRTSLTLSSGKSRKGAGAPARAGLRQRRRLAGKPRRDRAAPAAPAGAARCG